MSFHSNVLNQIERGKAGLNMGLPMGLKKLETFIAGVQKATYTVISAELGSGKSAFSLHSYVYKPALHLLSLKDDPTNKTKLKIIYFSMEIALQNILAKAAAWYLWDQYKILTDTRQITGRDGSVIPEIIEEKIKESKEFFDYIESIMTVYTGEINTNPTGINKIIHKYASEHGRFTTSPEGEVTYEPDDPDEIVEIIIDHIGLTEGEMGSKTGDKSTIDKLDKHIIRWRNLYGYSTVVVQQLGRALSSVDRMKMKRLTPQLSDLADTSETARSANIVMALFLPDRYDVELYPQNSKYQYNVSGEGGFGERFSSLSILKDRDGFSNIEMGLYWLGECGYFMELPTPDKVEELKRWYASVEEVLKHRIK